MYLRRQGEARPPVVPVGPGVPRALARLGNGIAQPRLAEGFFQPQANQPDNNPAGGEQGAIMGDEVNIHNYNWGNDLFPSFDGTSSRQAATEWLDKLVLQMDLRQMEPDHRPIYFKTKLSGNAWRWLKSLTEDQRGAFDQLTQLFRERFGVQGQNNHELTNELHTRKQLPNENVADYLAAVTSLGERLEVGDQVILHLAITGLKPIYTQKVLEQNPADMENLIRIAKNLETAAKVVGEKDPLSRVQEGMDGINKKLEVMMLTKRPSSDDRRVTFRDDRSQSPFPRDDRARSPYPRDDRRRYENNRSQSAERYTEGRRPSRDGQSYNSGRGAREYSANYGPNYRNEPSRSNEPSRYSEPSRYNNRDRPSRGGGPTQGARSRPFQGNCYGCGTYGHRASDCRRARHPGEENQ